MRVHTSDLRALVFAREADAALVSDLLSAAGIACHQPKDVTELCAEIQSGGGAVLLSDDVLNDPAIDELAHALDLQPGWSEIPVLLFASRRRVTASLEKLEMLRYVTLLD